MQSVRPLQPQQPDDSSMAVYAIRAGLAEWWLPRIGRTGAAEIWAPDLIERYPGPGRRYGDVNRIAWKIALDRRTGTGPHTLELL